MKVLNTFIPEYSSKKSLSSKNKLSNNSFIYIPKTPSEIGIHAELIFVGRMCDLGYEVYRPHTDIWAADFVVYKDNQYSKVQVKSSTKDDYNINLCNRAGKRYVDYVDYVAFISFTENRMYYIPVKDIPKDAKVLTNHLLRKYILEM